ncbi:transporter substrate-binding domain-containing protein, partial [bacterium]|nr:transporter substrate-binding domain-containing protein [bacterium]
MKVRKLLLPYTWGFGRFLLTILLGIFCFSLLSPAYSRQRDEEMIVAVLENWPPQYSIDPETKKPTGFAIDIFEQLARRLNIKIKYKVYHSWPEIMEAFEKGEIDIIPNLGITSERSDLYDFTTSVETFQIRIFVRDTTFTINSIGDLQKYRVGAVKSNKGLFLLESQKVKNIHVYNSLKEAFGGLLSGAVDALVYPEPPVLKLAYQSKLEDKIKTIGQPLLEVKRAIAVKKGN